MTKTEKREYITIANDLKYPKEVIDKLERANTDIACANILHDARMHMKDKSV